MTFCKQSTHHPRPISVISNKAYPACCPTKHTHRRLYSIMQTSMSLQRHDHESDNNRHRNPHWRSHRPTVRATILLQNTTKLNVSQ